METVEILGTSVHNCSNEQIIERIAQHIADHAAGLTSEPLILAFSNAEFLVDARTNHELRDYLNKACEINAPDGASLVHAARLLRKPMQGRVTGTDFVDALCASAAKRGWKLFFLGGKPGVADKAAANMQARYPALPPIQCEHGYHDDWTGPVANIAASDVDVLMVCLGNPRQEAWIAEHRDALGAKVMFGNGGALDFASGNAKRAPMVMQRMGMEWLFRLTQDFTVSRIKRQSRLPLYVYFVLLQALRGRP